MASKHLYTLDAEGTSAQVVDYDALRRNEAASDSNKLGGKAPEYYIQPRNLLDNSDFRNPVNQRGYSVYNTNSYTIDRWILYFSGATSFTIGQGLTFTCDTNGCSFFQRVSGVKLNQPYTIAYEMDGNVYTVQWSFVTEAEKYDVPIIVSEGTHVLTWAALYEGTYTVETLPPYIPKGYGAELAECQRYYWETDMVFRAAKTEVVSVLNIQFPRHMRVIPTITYNTAEGQAPEGSNMSKDGVAFYSTPANNFTLSNIKATADL